MVFDPDIRTPFGEKRALQHLIQLAPLAKGTQHIGDLQHLKIR
jgi:hypothetical protein